VVLAVRHLDPLERAARPALALIGRHAAIGEGQLDVLAHGQLADQIEALEDEPDLTIADARALDGRQRVHRTVVEPVLPAGGRVEQAEDGEQRRLAAPGGR